jgi:integrase/recombinase XerD
MRGKRRRGPLVLPDPGSDPEGLAAHTVDYLEWIRSRNFSERTVASRIQMLRAFAAWCADRGVTRSSEVTRPILERYQRWLFHYRKADGRPLTFHTQQIRLVSIRAFFKHLARQNRILSNPASDLDLPRRERRLPQESLTPQEAEQVLAQPDVTKPLGLRDRAMLETFYSTGLRRMELANLGVYDLDAERGTLTIRQGKGKKDRVVPIGERAVTWIEKYRQEARPELLSGPDTKALFLNELGESLGLDWLSILVRRYVEKARVGKTGSCHLFRHTLATVMLQGGADIRYIQEMLGHERLDTTQVYTQVSIRALKAIHNATHPAARLRKKDAPEDITAAILRVRPQDADPVHPLAADTLEEDAEA